MAGKIIVKNMNPERPMIKAAVDPDGTLEILIYGEIGAMYWYEDLGISAKTVRAQIDRAGDFSRVLMRINSPGGDAFEGIAIYNVIRALKKPVEVCVDGLAASSASIIAMAGDAITMGPNTMMMIHNAWTGCYGYASDMRKTADALDKISEAIAQTYVTRTAKTLEAVVALMDAETWMTAQECVAEGFATGIAAADSEPAALAMAKKFPALARLKKVPEVLKNSAPVVAPKAGPECECECDTCVAGECFECSNPDCVDANCVDCPMQAASNKARVVAPEESNLSLYEARARAMKLRLRAAA